MATDSRSIALTLKATNPPTEVEETEVVEVALQDESEREKNYGFVIDNRRCIGCHACSTACKSENEVPLGVYRTWVKYTESGLFPDSRRQFQVTRCNHCANPPCVRICPTEAMYQREDGIVEFNSDACIGCKACMQACPYDAIHIDPNTGTAAKCHYCSHRVEVGLEPACVVVCPTHAIISGDMNDPTTEIHQTLAKEQATVRKPEQGTAPNLFYVNGSDLSLVPTAIPPEPETFMWADILPKHGERNSGNEHVVEQTIKRSLEGEAVRVPQTQGLPNHGPIQVVGGTMAEHMVQQVGYNAQHKMPWHWPVPAYLVTKGISAGIFLLMVMSWVSGLAPFSAKAAVWGGAVSLFFIALTTFFLIIDLERPERFLFILLRPQWKSWLTRGAVLLIGFSTVLGAWWVLETVTYLGWLDPSWAAQSRTMWFALGLPFALGATIYTAFLFGQAEGRDLWQSSLLPFHLVVQAAMVGAASLLICAAFGLIDPTLARISASVFIGSLLLDLFVTLLGEFAMPHASDIAARAAHEISHGRYSAHFWWGSIGLGHVLPLVLIWAGSPIVGGVAGLCSIVGLYLFEYAFVMAPQEIPNS